LYVNYGGEILLLNYSKLYINLNDENRCMYEDDELMKEVLTTNDENSIRKDVENE